MFGLFRKKSHRPDSSSLQNSQDNWSKGLGKTRQRLQLSRFFLGQKTINSEWVDRIETQLLTADVGMTLTQHWLESAKEQLSRQALADVQTLYDHLRTQMLETLSIDVPETRPTDEPRIILVLGINGAGKTTTLAKLAHRFKSAQQSVLIAAADTYRTAAIEQLTTWGKRCDIPVIAQQTGSDSASVCYDAIASAKARHCDVVLIDTAGRLHTQHNLMAELEKMVRVIQKQCPNAPHEAWLVLDAGVGQNAICQAQQFNQSIPLTGLILSKMDGTAKGGIAFALCHALKRPIRYVGLGESIDDLQPFDPHQFIDALWADDPST